MRRKRIDPKKGILALKGSILLYLKK